MERCINNKIKEQLYSRAGIFKCRGHPTRLYMVEELAKGERCVCELTEMVERGIN